MNSCICAYLYISLCIEVIVSVCMSLCFSCILSWIICIEFVMALNIHQVFWVCIDPRVRKIRIEASSCPGIFSRTLRFYYVASSPGSPLPHLLDGHWKLHISSRSIFFRTGGAKMWCFSERMWQKSSQVKNKLWCARASHSSQKCDKCNASNFLSPKKVTNVTSWCVRCLLIT